MGGAETLGEEGGVVARTATDSDSLGSLSCRWLIDTYKLAKRRALLYAGMLHASDQISSDGSMWLFIDPHHHFLSVKLWDTHI